MRYPTTCRSSARQIPRLTSPLLLLALFLRIASTPTADFSYFLIAGYALLGRTQAIQALFFSWLFSMISPGIAAEPNMGAVGRYAVLLAAATSAVMRSRLLTIQPATLSTLLLGIFIISHSIFISPAIDVSILKTISWLLATCSLISAWLGLTAAEQSAVSKQIYDGLTAIMLASLPLLPLPLGYLRNDTGFQGMLNHPQAFGPTMALLGAWAAGQLLSQKPLRGSAAIIFGCASTMVLLSEARTAGIAMILGIGLSVALGPMLSGRSIFNLIPNLRSKRFLIAFALTAFGVILSIPVLSAKLSDYISKGGRAGTTVLSEAYEVSRGMLIAKMLANIEDRPLQGIGFGVASEPNTMDVVRDPVLNLPISAAIEKGVLPLAVLEELGLFGFLLVVSWTIALVRRSSYGGLTPLGVIFTAILLNLGESTLFSPGGLGLLSIVLIGWAFSCSKGKKRGESLTPTNRSGFGNE